MAIKLLLKDDVESLGRSGELVKVKPGYARNFLIPQGLALVADKQALRLQARLQEERAKRAVVDKKDADEQALKLEGLAISRIVKVDHEGHMYGSVSAHDVAELIQASSNIELEKKAVQLKQPIRELGEHKILIKLKEGVKATVLLTIEPEGGLPVLAPAVSTPAQE